MIKSLVGGTLRGKCIFIKCDPAFGECCSIQHRDNTIYRYFRLDARPGESANERLRQSQARGFDNNMLRRIVPREQHFHGWQEIVGNGATYAAIGKLNHLFRAQSGSAHPFTREPSKPMSPNSLTIRAMRLPLALVSKLRISVVLPAPRNPVTIVAGIFAPGCRDEVVII